MPDWFDEKNLSYFREWSGEVRFLQNISVKRQGACLTLASFLISFFLCCFCWKINSDHSLINTCMLDQLHFCNHQILQTLFVIEHMVWHRFSNCWRFISLRNRNLVGWIDSDPECSFSNPFETFWGGEKFFKNRTARGLNMATFDSYVHWLCSVQYRYIFPHIVLKLATHLNLKT